MVFGHDAQNPYEFIWFLEMMLRNPAAQGKKYMISAACKEQGIGPGRTSASGTREWERALRWRARGAWVTYCHHAGCSRQRSPCSGNDARLPLRWCRAAAGAREGKPCMASKCAAKLTELRIRAARLSRSHLKGAQ
mmetsp:Transcript_133062/g.296777  ORF Transcript_133062/g.296777 Transcript_133062/m.296777 type:complete len:136 (-) Transcript_133062:228-635(-)